MKTVGLGGGDVMGVGAAGGGGTVVGVHGVWTKVVKHPPTSDGLVLQRTVVEKQPDVPDPAGAIVGTGGGLGAGVHVVWKSVVQLVTVYLANNFLAGMTLVVHAT